VPERLCLRTYGPVRRLRLSEMRVELILGRVRRHLQSAVYIRFSSLVW